MVVFVECVWRPGVPVGAPTFICLFVAVFCLFVFKDRVFGA